MISEKDTALIAEVKSVIEALKVAGYPIDIKGDRVNTLYGRYLKKFKEAEELILISNPDTVLRPIKNPRDLLDSASVKADDEYAVLDAFGRMKPSGRAGVIKDFEELD